jgi:hypothetical protein
MKKSDYKRKLLFRNHDSTKAIALNYFRNHGISPVF